MRCAAMGTDAVPSLLSVLGHEDAFARNGAAEVLQDIGFVDFLALDDPKSPLLARIYAAGGERFREAAEARVENAAAAEGGEGGVIERRSSTLSCSSASRTSCS